MIHQDMEKVLNDQLNAELYAAHLYLSMAAYYESINLRGFAHWMRSQASEENTHALRFFDFINDREGRVTIQSLPEPPSDFGSCLGAMEAALKHERKVTGMIDDLYRTAQKHSDYASHVFLEWFVEEQVEEEKAAQDIIDSLNLIGDDKAGLFILDSKLGERSSE